MLHLGQACDVDGSYTVKDFASSRPSMRCRCSYRVPVFCFIQDKHETSTVHIEFQYFASCWPSMRRRRIIQNSNILLHLGQTCDFDGPYRVQVSRKHATSMVYLEFQYLDQARNVDSIFRVQVFCFIKAKHVTSMVQIQLKYFASFRPSTAI